MSKPRNTYKYEFKRGNKVVHSGITNDLERRKANTSGSRAGRRVT